MGVRLLSPRVGSVCGHVTVPRQRDGPGARRSFVAAASHLRDSSRFQRDCTQDAGWRGNLVLLLLRIVITGLRSSRHLQLELLLHERGSGPLLLFPAEVAPMA